MLECDAGRAADAGLAGLPADCRARPVRDDDALDLIALISRCWADYPGCVFDLDRENPELRTLASHMAGKGGALMVIERGGRIVAACGWQPAARAGWLELVKLYTHPDARRLGLARALTAWVIASARAQGMAGVELWTDTRFTTAHRHYQRIGFIASGRVRALHDLSDTSEYHYALALGSATA
ncbi:MAG: GNAT family N-acetyltransferase [Geminicoccaceae bacterium]